MPKGQWLLLAEVFGGSDLSKKEVALTKVEVIGRVIAPMSENATVDWVKRTALCDIPGNEGVAVKRDGLYRVTDKLLERKEQIEEFLREKEQGLFRLEQKIGRIKERYRRVTRYYEIETKQANGVISLHWRNNEEGEGKYDGSYLLRTNRRNLTEQEIWQLYVMLTRVERAFRNLKSDLGLRPIYQPEGTQGRCAYLYLSACLSCIT